MSDHQNQSTQQPTDLYTFLVTESQRLNDLARQSYEDHHQYVGAARFATGLVDRLGLKPIDKAVSNVVPINTKQLPKEPPPEPLDTA